MLRPPELTAVIGKARPAFALSDHRLLGELRGVAADGGVAQQATCFNSFDAQIPIAEKINRLKHDVFGY